MALAQIDYLYKHMTFSSNYLKKEYPMMCLYVFIALLLYASIALLKKTKFLSPYFYL